MQTWKPRSRLALRPQSEPCRAWPGLLCRYLQLRAVLPCKESDCNAGDLGSTPGLGRSSGEGTTPLFLPGKAHGQKNLAGDSPWGCKEFDSTKWLTHTENSPELWLSGQRASAGVPTSSPEATQAPPSLAVRGAEGVDSLLSRSLSLPGQKTQFETC